MLPPQTSSQFSESDYRPTSSTQKWNDARNVGWVPARGESACIPGCGLSKSRRRHLPPM